MKNLKKLAVVAASTLVLATGAHAAPLLTGSHLSYQYYFPNLASPIYASQSFVVGPGVEVPGPGTWTGSLNVSDTQIIASFSSGTFWSNGAFNGFVLSGLAATGFTGVTVDAATTATGFSASGITFDANNIRINWQGVAFAPGSVLVLDVAGPSVAAVPEPETYAMMLLGLGVVGFLARRRTPSRNS